MTKQMCSHSGWGMYADETGPVPAPVEMVATVCEHNVECPTCKFRMHIWPCEHKFNQAPAGMPSSYRVAVNGPMEVR